MARSPHAARYRGIQESVVPALQRDNVTPEGRLIFYTLKLMLGPIGMDYALLGRIARATGLTRQQVNDGLSDLQAKGWVLREDVDPDEPLLWIRNGLKHDPNIVISNPKHRPMVVSQLLPIIDCGLKRAFVEHYGLERYVDEWDSLSRYPMPIAYTHTLSDTPSDTLSDTLSEEGGQDTLSDTLCDTPCDRAGHSGEGEGEETVTCIRPLDDCIDDLAAMSPLTALEIEAAREEVRAKIVAQGGIQTRSEANALWQSFGLVLDPDAGEFPVLLRETS